MVVASPFYPLIYFDTYCGMNLQPEVFLMCMFHTDEYPPQSTQFPALPRSYPFVTIIMMSVLVVEFADNSMCKSSDDIFT